MQRPSVFPHLFFGPVFVRRIGRYFFDDPLQMRRFLMLSFTPGGVLRQMTDNLPGVIYIRHLQCRASPCELSLIQNFANCTQDNI